VCRRNHFHSDNLFLSPHLSLSLGRALAGLLWEQQQTGSHIPSFRFFLAHSPFIFMHSSSINTHRYTHKHIHKRAKNMLKTNTGHTHKHTPQRRTHTHINALINTQTHPLLKHYRFSPGEVFVFG